MIRARLVVAFAVVSLSGASALLACGDDSNTSDGGPDATSKDSATDAPATSDGGCPTYTGSSELCKAFVARCEACDGGGSATACQVASFSSYCEGLTPYFSQAYLDALASCESICDTNANTACAQSAVADASLTAAEKKLGTDYCSVCSDAGSACLAALNGQLAQYGDSFATTLDNACKPDGAAACAGFGTCLFATEEAVIPKPPCSDAGAD